MSQQALLAVEWGGQRANGGQLRTELQLNLIFVWHLWEVSTLPPVGNQSPGHLFTEQRAVGPSYLVTCQRLPLPPPVAARCQRH